MRFSYMFLLIFCVSVFSKPIFLSKRYFTDPETFLSQGRGRTIDFKAPSRTSSGRSSSSTIKKAKQYAINGLSENAITLIKSVGKTATHQDAHDAVENGKTNFLNNFGYNPFDLYQDDLRDFMMWKGTPKSSIHLDPIFHIWQY